MRTWHAGALPVAIGVVGTVACAARPISPSAPAAHAPSGSADAVVVVPLAASPSPEAPTLEAAADDAVVRLAAKLDALDEGCRATWTDGRVDCADAELDAIAATYQAYYEAHPDPRENEGRMDALPRLGGRGLSNEEVARRIRYQCAERCALARRITFAEAHSAAVEACVGKEGRAACAAFERRLAAAAPPDLQGRAAECQDKCDERRRQKLADAQRARNRPRTQAASEACFAKCKAHCEAGWCGTCEMSCQAACAVR